MAKRKRPSKHFRIVQTLKGRKRIVINPQIKKKTFKKAGTISAKDRQLFTHLSNPRLHNKEFGGVIDFNKKGRLENIHVSPGTSYEVEVHDDDYEVQYHTHPDLGISPPSPEDIMVLMENNRQQAEVVFRDGEAFVIIDSPKTKHLKNMSQDSQKKHLYKSFNKAMKHSDPYGEWARELEKEGFSVQRNNKPHKPLIINIKPKEPKRKNK